MLYFIVFILLSSISTQLADGLVCATNCDYSSNLEHIVLPSCNTTDKPVSEQSCRVLLDIDYITGAVTGQFNPTKLPKSANFAGLTAFSLYNESVTLRIEFDCFTSDECDLLFAKNVLNSNWTEVQTEVKSLRSDLADKLFNSTDLRPNDTCTNNQPCSGEGFCQTDFQYWSDTAHPAIRSTCANSTEQPILNWLEALDQAKVGDILLYTCNTPKCASQNSVLSVVRVISEKYALPFNVTIPITTTTITTTTTTTPASTISTTSTTSTRKPWLTIHFPPRRGYYWYQLDYKFSHHPYIIRIQNVYRKLRPREFLQNTFKI
ncbi:unnamed protein product [Adineta steineri]|uniref:Uncharacterized protein n=1 Tax=Adineta steineri TaxID=433720 RepID=A0A815PMJ5_9BILA|nr:unnamed protein product [Adineta steineri]CAF1630750.1 unnamed protein product [Adineta steineri]